MDELSEKWRCLRLIIKSRHVNEGYVLQTHTHTIILLHRGRRKKRDIIKISWCKYLVMMSEEEEACQSNYCMFVRTYITIPVYRESPL